MRHPVWYFCRCKKWNYERRSESFAVFFGVGRLFALDYCFGGGDRMSDWSLYILSWLTRMKPRLGLSRSAMRAMTMEIMSGATAMERIKRRRTLNPKLKQARMPIERSIIQMDRAVHVFERGSALGFEVNHFVQRSNVDGGHGREIFCSCVHRQLPEAGLDLMGALHGGVQFFDSVGTIGKIDARADIFAEQLETYGAGGLRKSLSAQRGGADGVGLGNNQFPARIEARQSRRQSEIEKQIQ
jgi:hypothetical protein